MSQESKDLQNVATTSCQSAVGTLAMIAQKLCQANPDGQPKVACCANALKANLVRLVNKLNLLSQRTKR